jgi:hypothetical protein
MCVVPIFAQLVAASLLIHELSNRNDQFIHYTPQNYGFSCVRPLSDAEQCIKNLWKFTHTERASENLWQLLDMINTRPLLLLLS